MVPADLPPGKAFDEAIVEQIGRSDIVALLFSRCADASHHVKAGTDPRGQPGQARLCGQRVFIV